MTDLAFLPISTWQPGFVAAIRAHYTGSRGAPPGKKQAWEVWHRGELIAHIGLGEPTFKLAARRALGLEDGRPLEHTVCCFIFRRTGAHPEVRGSDILRAWHPVARAAWRQRYGWEPVHWETLVQASAVASQVPGACFRRSGYRRVGETTGWSVRRPAGHSHGTRVWSSGHEPKLVFYRGPLARRRG